MLILVLLIRTFTQAQSLDLLDHTGVSVAGQTLRFFEPGGVITAHISLGNLTPESKNVQVRKVYVDIAENTQNYFCWGSVPGFEVFETTNTLAIGAGEVDEDTFSGHYLPEPMF